MKTDIEIARETAIRPITEIGAQAGVKPEWLETYGGKKAKINNEGYREIMKGGDGRLVLVTAISPTPAGEGKTTTTIGLSMALNRIGAKSVCALREPSLGPCFGIKGGAAGGGYSQVLPMEDINLHFTGDFHAITSANNLCAAMLDNHIHQGNALGIDPKRVVLTRCVDMNDRALRGVVVGLGAKGDGVTRQDSFKITVASEVMAILCLAEDLDDLTKRLGDMIIAYRRDNTPVMARDIKADGAMAVLLKDAIDPNLVQTTENTPAIIHGGPFANIAHGCNSVRATRLALRLSDVCVTEAGFGADLGAEKFLDIKCRKTGLRPGAVVIVATVRALAHHGGVDNLCRHIENMRNFGLPVVVALNSFYTDSDDDVAKIKAASRSGGARFAVSKVFAEGGAGGEELAKAVLAALNDKSELKFIYEDDDAPDVKIEKIVKNCYGGEGVIFTEKAAASMKRAVMNGFGNLPVCMAKTQYSFSDNPALLGAPEGFYVTVRDVTVSAGAGFLVALTGDIMTMPGLPKEPAAERIYINSEGCIEGLF